MRPKHVKRPSKKLASESPFAKMLKESDDINIALKSYWKEFKLPHKPNKAWISDDPHKGQEESYTSCYFQHGKMHFHALLAKRAQVQSPIHLEAYQKLHQQMNKEHLYVLQRQVHTVAIRSNADELFIVLQVERHTAKNILLSKKLSQWFQREWPEVKGLALLQIDHAMSWITPSHKSQSTQWKLIHGPDWIRFSFAENSIVIPWEEFLRPYRSLLPEVIEKISQWLNPRPEQTLLDMYSGSGFWSIIFAKKFAKVFAIDVRQQAKVSLHENAKRQKILHVKSVQNEVSSNLFEKLSKTIDGDQLQVLLDPPPGPLPVGLIKSIGQKQTCRILRIYPSVEEFQDEVKKWKRAGYILRKALPIIVQEDLKKFELFCFYEIDRDGVLEKRKQATEKRPNPTGIRFIQK
jgi:tRNA/tmRNA/rRNA uracil-C5-methylase (TrmA/RlmC/RlmD family)